MKGTSRCFRVGRVRADCRGSVWYLTYHEQGVRRRSRVGSCKESARQLAAQINSQLELGIPSALSFEPVTIADLRQRWLDHHEFVLRSSVHTINRYRTATAHLLRHLGSAATSLQAAHFRLQHAEQFVRYLRRIEVAPNGHPKAAKRPLLDKGIKYILETCRSMFHFAMKHRHLSPYAENPFTGLELDRIPVENSKPIVILTPEQERSLLNSCDRWQFPIFLTLMLTGMRPGELTHLLLPDDLDLETGLVRIRNKSPLGWQVKTRTEREIPLIQPLLEVLRLVVGQRAAGPVFLRRRFHLAEKPLLASASTPELTQELAARLSSLAAQSDRALSRRDRLRVARGVWRDAGAIKPERIRLEFIRLARRIGVPQLTAPKVLRHGFATSLQDGNVDSLIRCELMGHSTRAMSSTSHQLGMTAHYTHTRVITKRGQLEKVLQTHPAVRVARTWIERFDLV